MTEPLPVDQVGKGLSRASSEDFWARVFRPLDEKLAARKFCRRCGTKIEGQNYHVIDFEGPYCPACHQILWPCLLHNPPTP